MNIHPASAIRLGNGYSQMRYGRSIFGAFFLSSATANIWPANCTMILVAIRTSITIPSEKKLQMIATTPITRRET